MLLAFLMIQMMVESFCVLDLKEGVFAKVYGKEGVVESALVVLGIWYWGKPSPALAARATLVRRSGLCSGNVEISSLGDSESGYADANAKCKS